MHKGKRDLAVETLDRALARTDGCALRGVVDPMTTAGVAGDWLLACADQVDVYDALLSARSVLAGD
ncbi:MAG: hypothetical protein IT385_18880 [Deltaproteobacteria bacterium]|nr:hypothetical protein [Deltaproteobacteria bacterium]